MPVLDVSHTTHIGSSDLELIGQITGVLQHTCFIMLKHRWCTGFQWKGAPFWVIPWSGEVYIEMLGRKVAT